MTKREFLNKLKVRLSGLPKAELDERIGFYSEMIDDRMEEGLSEEKAVEAVGSVEDAARRTSSASGTRSLEAVESGEREVGVWRSIILVVTAPVWLSLLLVAAIVGFALYLTAWIVIVTLWAVELPFYIMYWISRGLFIACKYSTIGLLKFTKLGTSWLKDKAKGR